MNMNNRRYRTLLRIICALLAIVLMTGCGALKNLLPAHAETVSLFEVSEETDTIQPQTETLGEPVLLIDEPWPEKSSAMSVDSEAVIPDTGDSRAELLLQGMTTEQKVAQLFFVAPEALAGVDAVTRTGDVMKQAFLDCPVGGILYSTPNLVEPEQTFKMLHSLQEYAVASTGIPVFISVDEEGGHVVRLAKKDGFGLRNVGTMASLGGTGDIGVAAEAGRYIGGYLSHYGFNMDFAPVTDVLTNPTNQVIGDRSFGSDPQLV